mmetsp:Transcript_53724/g.149023  ORF Transcript_53724/g.149023 Transcript_53724/m.149023 type:complete len:110 (+) Transcript_53724:544-873(+)
MSSTLHGVPERDGADVVAPVATVSNCGLADASSSALGSGANDNPTREVNSSAPASEPESITGPPAQPDSMRGPATEGFATKASAALCSGLGARTAAVGPACCASDADSS